MEKYLVKTVNNIEADASGNVDGTALGFIPLTGTTVGNPITGDIEIQDGLKIFPTIDGGGYYLGDNNIGAISIGANGFINIINNFTNNPLFRGLCGNDDYTPNITDLDYTQKIYVDTKAPLTPRVQSITSSATVTPTSTNDLVTITAQAVDLTLANPTGTFAEGQALMIRIKDNGTAQAITFGSNYRAIGVTLPTTTIANKILYLGIIYDSIDAKWNILGTPQQA